jgi:hypothetical protein
VTRAPAVAAVAALVLSCAGVALAASFTLTTAGLGGTGLATPIMYPYVVTTANAGGKAVTGRIDRNDTVSVVWSRPIDQPTLCSSLSNGTPSSSSSITWIVQNNTGTTGNDVLVPGTVAGCNTGMHVGSIDLGSPGYITGSNGTFAAATTTLSVGTTITSLQVTIPGAPTGGTVGTVSSGSAAVWTPDPAVTDLAGRNCGTSLAQTATTVQF